MDSGNVIINSNQTVLCFFSTAVMVFFEICNLNYNDSVMPWTDTSDQTKFQASRSKDQE